GECPAGRAPPRAAAKVTNLETPHERPNRLARRAISDDASDGGSRSRDDRRFQDRADTDDGERGTKPRAPRAFPLSRVQPARPARLRAGGGGRQRRPGLRRRPPLSPPWGPPPR